MELLNLQHKLEFLAQKKIRRGFQKFIQVALEYFNITEIELINEEQSVEIIKFLNSSNSKCSLSYWILRKRFSKEEAMISLKKYNEEFLNSSYKYTTRAIVSKNHVSKNFSRGYSGYIDIQGHQKYCRSANEFILWHILSAKYGIENIKYEHSVFNINDIFNYKPDYFIYENNVLTKIIEAKDLHFIHDEKYELISNFFQKLKIDYEIICNAKSIATPLVLKLLQEWKDSDRSTGGNKGTLNPRYGVMVSDVTKKRISDGVNKYYQDMSEKSKQKRSDKIKQRYIDNPELRKKCSISAKLREKNMSVEMKKAKIEKTINTVQLRRYHDILCIAECGTLLHIMKNKDPICKKCKYFSKLKELPEKMGKNVIETFFREWISDTSLEYVINKLLNTPENNLNYEFLLRKKDINRINAKVGIKSILKYYISITNLVNKLKSLYENNISTN